MKQYSPLRLLAALSLATASFFAQAASSDVTVAYQTNVDPAKVAQADGAYEKATDAKINWRKFDNGADIIAAIASGDVQIGYLGSSPLTAAITRNVPVETFLIATQIGGSEALVARNGSGINGPQDLVGKKVAVPFVSTGHYSLLAALKHWNIDPCEGHRFSTLRRPPSLPPGSAVISTPPTCGTRRWARPRKTARC
jgi:taurine transport system substrate-binding protein